MITFLLYREIIVGSERDKHGRILLLESNNFLMSGSFMWRQHSGGNGG
jgi:hypothetical protein